MSLNFIIHLYKTKRFLLPAKNTKNKVYKLEWYKYCPVCYAQGSQLTTNPENLLISYHCQSCNFNWTSESQCKYHIQDKDGGHLCNRDTSIGECRGDNCPRLKKIRLHHQGFSEKTEIDRIMDDLKAAQDIPEL